MNRNVILTGASGFIGRYLLQELRSKGYSVHCIVHSKEIENFENHEVFFHRIDLLEANDEDLLNLFGEINAKAIFHSAWYTNHKDYLVSSENTRWLDASKRMAKAFYQSGGSYFLALGSCIEYDFSMIDAQNPKLHVNHEIGSELLYGRCKIELSRYLERLAKEFSEEFLWCRVFFVYGPYDRPGRLIPYIVSRIKSNEKATPNYGGASRDYIYVEDLAKQIVSFYQKGFTGFINSGTGKGVRIKTVFKEVGKILNRPDLVEENDKLSQDFLNEPEYVIAGLEENHLLRSYTPLKEGISKTLIWMKESEIINTVEN